MATNPNACDNLTAMGLGCAGTLAETGIPNLASVTTVTVAETCPSTCNTCPPPSEETTEEPAEDTTEEPAAPVKDTKVSTTLTIGGVTSENFDDVKGGIKTS